MRNFNFDKTTIDSIKAQLLKKGETVAVAESVTSGMLQLALSTADKAIYFYQGGITAYNIGQKTRHLYIDPVYAEACNCVSEKTVTEMAINICRKFTSDWGIAVSGYASPVPESGNKLFAWYAIAYKGKVRICKRITPSREEPIEVQANYCNEILKAFRQAINKKFK